MKLTNGRAAVRRTVAALAVCAATGGATRAADTGRPDDAGTQVASEKASRTEAQKKIASPLLFEIYRLRGEAEAKSVPPGPTIVRLDERSRALVDVRVAVTDERLGAFRALEGVVVSVSEAHDSIIVWLPLVKLEQIAEDDAVRAIVPAAEAMTR